MALGVTNIRQNLAKLQPNEKVEQVYKTHTAGLRAQTMTFVTEPGLYKLMFWCRASKTEGTPAARFVNWVVYDVLPSIRKTGQYQLDQRIQELEARVNEQNAEMNNQADELTELEDRFSFSPFKTLFPELGLVWFGNWKETMPLADQQRVWLAWRRLKQDEVVFQPNGDTSSNYESTLPLAEFVAYVQNFV